MSPLSSRLSVRPKALACFVALAGGVLTFSEISQGAGYALNESSSSAAGTAYAGRAAAARDASALAANPGAISSLEQEQWTAVRLPLLFLKGI